MSIPTTLVDLSVVADDNTLINSSRVNTVDDYVRALAAIIKRQGTIHECTFAGSVLNIGSHGSTHIANPTSNISGMTGSFSDGVTDIVFMNTSPITISSGDTLVTDTFTVLKGDTITVKKASTGVFTVIGISVYPKTRLEAIETKNTSQDNTLASHANSINTLAANNYPHATASSIGFNTTANNLVNVGALAIVLPENQFGIYQVVVRLDISTDNVSTFLKTVVDRKYLTGLPQPNTVTQSSCKFVAPSGSYNETVSEQSFLVSYVSGQSNVMHIGFTGVDASGGNGNGTVTGSLVQYAVRLGV